MARPRKDSDQLDAKQRINEAFWSLLAAHELRDISVSMIVAEARCNRGTFYYHYRDMDALVYGAIEQDLTAPHSIAEAVFGIATSNSDWIGQTSIATRFARLCLIMDKGGMKVVDHNVKAVVINLWRAVLCPDGSELTPESEIVITFHVSGILGALSYLATSRPTMQAESLCTLPYFEQSSKLLLEQLSAAQHVPVEEIAARLSAAAMVARMDA